MESNMADPTSKIVLRDQIEAIAQTSLEIATNLKYLEEAVHALRANMDTLSADCHAVRTSVKAMGLLR